VVSFLLAFPPIIYKRSSSPPFVEYILHAQKSSWQTPLLLSRVAMMMVVVVVVVENAIIIAMTVEWRLENWIKIMQ
jgi:hypothetical protein